jgi:hypothetical protein
MDLPVEALSKLAGQRAQKTLTGEKRDEAIQK